jgi:ferredoxin--NADP+ reductase
VRWASETAVVHHQIGALRVHEFLGPEVRAKLRYYPAVTREPHSNQGRLTALIESGRLFEELGLPPLDVAFDRVMVCGSSAMLEDSCALLNARGFVQSPHIGEAGDYLIERAFVTR